VADRAIDNVGAGDASRNNDRDHDGRQRQRGDCQKFGKRGGAPLAPQGVAAWRDEAGVFELFAHGAFQRTTNRFVPSEHHRAGSGQPFDPIWAKPVANGGVFVTAVNER
jgi:hypothetical protein